MSTFQKHILYPSNNIYVPIEKIYIFVVYNIYTRFILINENVNKFSQIIIIIIIYQLINLI